MITGKTLIAWGYKPGPWFAAAIAAAEQARCAGADEPAIRAIVERFAPAPAPPSVSLRDPGALPYRLNVRAEDQHEADNIASVERHMRELMRVPTLVAGSVMPDACPAGSAPGTIPVGGIAAAKNAIHPGMHSADICCSMAVTIFGDTEPTAILDAGMKLSHFGGGGRPRGQGGCGRRQRCWRIRGQSVPRARAVRRHRAFCHAGDGNHFFYVGRVASTGQIALVTHHGSRKPGAMLYKAGMETAERFRGILSPETPKHNAWIPVETNAGEAYWQALQAIRSWTKANHYAIHDLIADALGLQRKDRFWNEHNFVFRKSDGLFYHAKGATPAWAGFAADSSGLTLIPLNMAEPILITRGLTQKTPWICAAWRRPEFQPHGLHAPARWQDRAADRGRADGRHRRPFLLR
jgi:hypothetical protein